MSIYYSSKGRKKLFPNILELVNYRDLFWILAYRDLRVRYAQTFLGLLWAVIQPLTTLIIFTLVFGRVARVDTGEIPYPLFAVCGMAAWSYFAFVLSQSGNSIIAAQEMIKKIYFPRLVIPLSKAVVGFVDFFVTFLFVVILLLYFDYPVSVDIVYLPIFVLLVIIGALGFGIWLSALTIRYRDFQHILPFIVQFGLYASPVGYPASLVVGSLPDWLSFTYYLNPMAGIIEGFRWCLLQAPPPTDLAYVSFVVIFVIFVSSLLYFRRVEKIMADIV